MKENNHFKISELELERRLYRKKQSYKSVLISCASVLILAIVLYIVLSNSKGWALVAHTYFNPEVFVRSLPKVFQGILVNIKILFFAVIGVGILATLLAVARSINTPLLFPLKLLSVVYTDLFRGMPLIIVIYLIGFGLPGLMPNSRPNPEILGAVCIIVVYSAYVSEVIRAGIEAIHPSQKDAARSLGLSHARTLRTIILPQAIRKVIPALMNDFVAMQKDVGLVSMLGAVDAVRAAQIQNAIDFNYTHYVVAGVLFILMSFPFIRLTNWYSKKFKEREEKGSNV